MENKYGKTRSSLPILHLRPKTCNAGIIRDVNLKNVDVDSPWLPFWRNARPPNGPVDVEGAATRDPKLQQCSNCALIRIVDMATKADYLKKYLDSTAEKKKKRRLKKRSNLAVHDDDVDWRTLAPVSKECDRSDSDEKDPDEAPLVAEFKDESVRKWQPLSNENTMKFENESSSDEGIKSVPRKRRMDSPELSPRRRNDTSDAEDLSPPRQRRSLSPDLSPPRRGRQKGEDLSPPRQRRALSPDLSPPRRGKWRGEDLSPARQRGALSPDLSPPRRGAESNRLRGEDISQSHRRLETKVRARKRRPLSPAIISSSNSKKMRTQSGHTERISQGRVQDIRQESQTGVDSPEITRQYNTSDSEATEDMIIGKVSDKKAGLKSAQEAKLEAKSATKHEEPHTHGLESGKHAETVYRDKTGRKIDPKLERIKREQEERVKAEENEQFMLWGRG